MTEAAVTGAAVTGAAVTEACGESATREGAVGVCGIADTCRIVSARGRADAHGAIGAFLHRPVGGRRGAQ